MTLQESHEIQQRELISLRAENKRLQKQALLRRLAARNELQVRRINLRKEAERAEPEAASDTASHKISAYEGPVFMYQPGKKRTSPPTFDTLS